MPNLKILLLNSLYIYGGGEFFTFLLSSYLKKTGFDVFLSCPVDTILDKKCKQKGIKVFNLDYPKIGRGNLRRTVGEIKKIIKNYGIQIVHSNTNFDRTAGAFATMRTKAVHTASVHSYYSIQRNLTHLIRNKYYIKHFIASGEKIKELLTEKDNIPPNKITAINLGIEADEFRRDKILRKKIRRELNIHDNEIVIGNVGRIVKFKGQENLIKAFCFINKKFPETKLIVTGSGELESKLKELCEQLLVKDKVIFTGFKENLLEIYSAFDIYAHTSLKGTEELFPFAILNAMAQGLPVIAVNTGEINIMVKDNINGYLIESSEPEQIAEKIERLILDKEKRESFGMEGLKLLSSKFTIEKMGRAISDLYYRLL